MVNSYPDTSDAVPPWVPRDTAISPTTGQRVPRVYVQPQAPGTTEAPPTNANPPGTPPPLPRARPAQGNVQPTATPGAQAPASAPAAPATPPGDERYAVPYDPLNPPKGAEKAPAAAPGKADTAYAIPYDPLNPPKQEGSDKVMGRGEAGVVGMTDAMTLNTAPLIGGAGLAMQTEGEKHSPTMPLPELETAEGMQNDAAAKSMVGAYRIIKNWITGQPQDPETSAAFERGRQEGVADRRAARDQQPNSYALGQIAGMLMTAPVLTVGRGAAAPTRLAEGSFSTLVPMTAAKVQRIAGASATGAVGGAAQGAGEAASEEKSLPEIGQAALEEGAGGALFGAAGGAAAEGLETGARAVASAFRGARGTFHAGREAARRVGRALAIDRANKGRFGLSREQEVAAERAGTPTGLVDYGGEETRSLAVSAANTSPEAADILKEFSEERFHQQAPRISDYIRSVTGGPNAGMDNEVLHKAARLVNRPRYVKAYRSAPNPLQSDRLAELAQADAVQKAIAKAEKQGSNKAIEDGLGKMFDPKIHNMQFWDYVQRNLADHAQGLLKKHPDEAIVIKGLNRQLKEELDRIVPEFGEARRGAAAFFGAEDALEAGQKFVMQNADIGEVRRALAKMSAPERELFARGFASDLADKVIKLGDSVNVVNQAFLKNRQSREKIELALGPQRAKQVETLLRAEGVVDQLRKALQRSTTFKQAVEGGLAGGTATALYDLFEGNEFSPSKVLQNAMLAGSGNVIKGKLIGTIDQRVAKHVAMLLTSDRPELLQEGLKIITTRPGLLDAFRQGTSALARFATQEVGVKKAAAVGASLMPTHGEGASE